MRQIEVFFALNPFISREGLCNLSKGQPLCFMLV